MALQLVYTLRTRAVFELVLRFMVGAQGLVIEEVCFQLYTVLIAR